MGQISSSVGLVSGIDFGSLIDQLMQIEARPQRLVQSRNAVLTSQQVAFKEINAKLLGLKLSADSLANTKTFNATTATSSDESVLTASTGTSTTAGTYDFTVDRLLSTQQMITRGFQDQDVTAMGAATLTFEFGLARLDSDMDLGQLNGAAGITRGKIRITDRSGTTEVVDLSKALRVSDVLDAINAATTIDVTASVVGDAFVIEDNTGLVAASLSVADVGGSGTTASLGLDAAAVGTTLTGTDVNTISGDTLLSTLNDGTGVRINSALADLQIVDDSGTYSVDLGSSTTIDDVIAAIDAATASNVTAAASGAGLTLTGTGNVTVTALNSSLAAYDLGIEGTGVGTLTGQRVIAALNSTLIKSLNGSYTGGADTKPQAGVININGGAGSNNVDLSTAQSVSDVIGLINAGGAGATAVLNAAGNGLVVTDDAGVVMTITDNSGNLASFLNVDGASDADGVTDSGNLQLGYITTSTLLSSLNGGRGVARGKLTITDSDGDSATVDLSQGNETTIGDVLDEINSRGLNVTASVNANGDGILLTDIGAGGVAITVAEAGSTTASDLGLLGEAAAAGADLDGTFEKTVTIDAAATLDDVVTAINEAGIGVRATIINDGSVANPYRLSLMAATAGKAGQFVFDDGALSLEADTLSEARNTVVFYGSSDPANAIAISSATNTLNNVIPGATITLHSTSDSATRLIVSRDYDGIITAVENMVSGFNRVVETLDKYDTYNAETEERGLLLGDVTISRIRSAMFNRTIRADSDLTGQYKALSQLGVNVGSGTKLTFDSSKMRTALENDLDSVVQLFTLRETETDAVSGEITITAGGIGVDIAELLNRLTETSTGTLANRLSTIDKQLALNEKRIEQMDVLLEGKRQRLLAQFIAMEQAIAQLQSQGSSLAGLQSLSSYK